MKELYNAVRALEGDKRFEHTISVANECKKIAEIFSLTVPLSRRLYKAALLHDITKHLSYDEHIALALANGIVLSENDLKSPSVLHQITGAVKARIEFAKYTDDVVYSAIRKHTTGSSDMSLADKILFLADYIEPTRKYNACIETREYFYSLLECERRTKALDLAIIRCYENTIAHLNGKFIHPDTLTAYNALNSQYQRKD